ncbi:DUF4113 domain-containing protein [Pseudomonas syringae]|uniref:DUF4113 domain-containing protein n=1 Tax=Pseudomonas syringae TaxID=317 RepID=UPI0032C05C71
MCVLDRINVKLGQNALHSGRMSIDAPQSIKREIMSKSHSASTIGLMRFQAR